MTRRRTSFGLRCWQGVATPALLVGVALVLHALFTWIFGLR